MIPFTSNKYPCEVKIGGASYHHVTGYLESMKHRGNPEFAEAIRKERSPNIALEMGDVHAIKWADLDAGKRALTPSELESWRRHERAYLCEALRAKFRPGSRLRCLLERAARDGDPEALGILATIT